MCVCMYVCMCVFIIALNIYLFKENLWCCNNEVILIVMYTFISSCITLQQGVVKKFCALLELVGNFGNNSASHHLTAHMFAAAHMILKLAPPSDSEQA